MIVKIVFKIASLHSPYLGVLRARFGWFGGRVGTVLDRFGVRFVDSIHRSDSMMRFVVSIR